MLTAEDHGEDGEDFLEVGDRRDVAEADAGKYREREIERRDVARPEVARLEVQ